MKKEFKKIIFDLNIKTDVVVVLGNCTVRIKSNEVNFNALKYFSNSIITKAKEQSTEFTLTCVSLKEFGHKPKSLKLFVDKTCRGGQLTEGYYVTDHFGDPFYLVSEEADFYIFGEKFEKIIWPYFVKYFLLLHTIKNKSLFLKSAAFSINSKGTLILGRGRSGKTVFLSNLCLNGADFISNSHTIVKDDKLHGITSSMRIRPDLWCEKLFTEEQKTPGIKANEFIIDPHSVFSLNSEKPVKIYNICILNFKGSGFHKITKITHKQAYDYAEQFSLGLNVYRLEEDLLDYYQNNLKLFSNSVSTLRKQLKKLIQNCNCYHISSDVLNPKYRDKVIKLLSI